ncbi:unnamed protein product [Cuscuta europaea]|uniref:Protein WUSCHEL n=1 Tax=Cuscuta europaea TaxID=41803 RepID=A0A9P0ZMS4_CUSEU|nr:unnamed protein product [Cuscuta europaea]
MEPQQQNYCTHPNQTQNGNPEEGGGGGSKSNGGAAGYLCRQSSTRWTPTTEQIRILKELYYNNGVRSPSAEQIQRISAKLRQYGKIEGKNVFYWFQNHKARERQKKRLTVVPPDAAAAFSMQMQRGVWRSAADQCSNFNNPQASSPASGVVNVGQIGNYSYGSTVAMERSFRNCSISAGGASNGGGGCHVAAAAPHNHHNYAWVGVDHHHPYNPAPPYYPFLEKIRAAHETLEEDHDDQERDQETLPLFPIHADHHMPAATTYGGCYYSNADQWCRRYDDNGGGSAARAMASLELSLNSYNNLATSSSHHFT